MSDLFERILLLKNSTAFSHVQTEDLKIVAHSLEKEKYLAGERVFDIDEYGDCMYILQQGRVGISLDNQASYVAELGRGDCFGEMNLLDDLPRSASAYVLEDSTLLSLEKSKLNGLIISYPEICFGILKGLSLRLRQANLASKKNESA